MYRRSTSKAGPSSDKGTPSTSHNHNHSTASTASSSKGKHDHDHDHDHSGDENEHEHEHGGLFHTHAHDHSEGAEQILNAFKSGHLDRGTKITLLGLGSNVALTATKGLAGLWMNSASLLAEAGHSLSDLLGVSSTWLRRVVHGVIAAILTPLGLCDARDVENIPQGAYGQVSLGLQQV
jgi:hypothetical protein